MISHIVLKKGSLKKNEKFVTSKNTNNPHKSYTLYIINITSYNNVSCDKSYCCVTVMMI
jgi:hypothetical protein